MDLSQEVSLKNALIEWEFSIKIVWEKYFEIKKYLQNRVLTEKENSASIIFIKT